MFESGTNILSQFCNDALTFEAALSLVPSLTADENERKVLVSALYIADTIKIQQADKKNLLLQLVTMLREQVEQSEAISAQVTTIFGDLSQGDILTQLDDIALLSKYCFGWMVTKRYERFFAVPERWQQLEVLATLASCWKLQF
jgi:hypothetical protein